MIAVYLRVSTDKQDEAMQRAAIERYLEGTEDPVARLTEYWYIDVGISGTITDRPSYKAMLLAVSSGDIHKIVVYEYSRLWRDLEEQNRVLKILQALNIELYSVTEGPVKSIEDKFKANVLGAANVYEAERLRRRIRDGIQRKKDAVANGKDVWNGRGPDKKIRKNRYK